MTPKEKAEQLVNNYINVVPMDFGGMDKDLAKQCALIAVDEIIWEIIKYSDNSKEYVVANSEFCQEVKQEIEKL